MHRAFDDLDLPTAAAELWGHAAEHYFDPIIALAEKKLPPWESYRTFEHRGIRYRATFSRIKSAGVPRESYLLSIIKLEGLDDDAGTSCTPSEEEGAEIAAAFFPKGCMALPQKMDALKLSRKYIALK